MLPIGVNSVETTEILISSINKLKYFFDDLVKLRKKNCIYIEFNNVYYVAKSPANRDVINADAFNEGYLILTSNKNEVINRVPLNIFSRSRNSVYYPLIGLDIDWSKSYIEFSTGSNLVENEAVIASIYYDDRNKLIKVDSADNTKMECIELLVRSVAETVFRFDSYPQLKNKKIKSVVFHPSVITPSGYSPINSTVLKKSYLTLNCNGRDKISKIPVKYLRDDYLANNNHIVFNGIDVDWANSYIEIPNTASLAANEAYCILIMYEDNQR